MKQWLKEHLVGHQEKGKEYLVLGLECAHILAEELLKAEEKEEGRD